MKVRLFLAAVAATLFLASCSGQVEGVVLVVGNEPFARAVLALDAGGTLNLAGEAAGGLGAYAHRRVRLEGRLLEGEEAAGALPPGATPGPVFEVRRILRVFD